MRFCASMRVGVEVHPRQRLEATLPPQSPQCVSVRVYARERADWFLRQSDALHTNIWQRHSRNDTPRAAGDPKRYR